MKNRQIIIFSKIFQISKMINNLLVKFFNNTKLIPRGLSYLASAPKFDQLQELALKENCILVDENDKIIGSSSKKDCHLVNNGNIKLHRAFSVFLFNSKGDMLVQRRSIHKVCKNITHTSNILSFSSHLLIIVIHLVNIAKKYIFHCLSILSTKLYIV